MRPGDERRHVAGEPDAGAEARPELGLERGEGHDAVVAAQVRVVRGDAAGQGLAAALGRVAQAEARHRRRGEAERAVDHRDIEQGAFARLVALAQGAQDRDDAPQAAGDVGELPAGHRGRGARGAHQPEQPGARQVVEIVAGALRERARLPVAGQRADDEPGRGGPQGVVAEAEAGEHAGPELLEEHVVAGQEAHERAPPGRPFEVEHEAALAPVERGERGRLAPLAEGRHRAQVVAAARVFELVDPGAEVGEHERGEGARQEARQVEDANAVEGSQGPLSSLPAAARQAESAKSFCSFIASIGLPVTLSFCCM